MRGCYSVLFACCSDAGLATGANISSARRWISLSVSGCYSVFSGCYSVFLFVTVMRRSARELMFLVLVVGSLSVLLTYHLTWRLPQRDHGTLRIRFDGRLEIFRSVVVPAPPNGKDKREVIEAPPYGEDKREGIEAPSYGGNNHQGLQAPPYGEDTHQGLEGADLETPGGGRHK